MNAVGVIVFALIGILFISAVLLPQIEQRRSK